MEIHSASFIISSPSLEKCPQAPIPEYAFIGRSNVGKSSLINILTNQKKLAKTSGTPGKTQLINHFLINKSWHLVDLPGYGYAKASKKKKRAFKSLIQQYFEGRQQLISTFVLIDCRHKPQNNDLNFMTWLGENQIPFSIVFTKADKLKENDLNKNIEHYKEVLKKTWAPLPQYFITSSIKKRGKRELLAYIDKLNHALQQ